MHYDVFNGDADGIIALLQLRWAEPKSSVLITGVKRDIQLLQQVDPQQADSVTVLDISLQKNCQALVRLLAANIEVTYFDHHQSGDIPQHPKLSAIINTDANICTALLVNHHLKNRYPLWAIAGAFGDNLRAVALSRAKALGLEAQLTTHLEQLGTCINYNGYGRSEADLHFAPDQLYRLLSPFDDINALIDDKGSPYYQLWDAYQADIAKAKQAETVFADDHCKVMRLPDQAWAHRVSGVYGNLLANQNPNCAHGVLTDNADGQSYTVSVRAPLSNKQGADILCSRFATGGGRAGAAGINVLPHNQLGNFITAMRQQYG